MLKSWCQANFINFPLNSTLPNFACWRLTPTCNSSHQSLRQVHWQPHVTAFCVSVALVRTVRLATLVTGRRQGLMLAVVPWPGPPHSSPAPATPWQTSMPASGNLHAHTLTPRCNLTKLYPTSTRATSKLKLFFPSNSEE